MARISSTRQRLTPKRLSGGVAVGGVVEPEWGDPTPSD
jgi:hypothetical protein